MQKHKDGNKVAAFTLVEMLVVLVIIGALAGMILLSSGSSVALSEKNVCLADRKTIRSAYAVERAEEKKSFGEAIAKAMAQFNKAHAAASTDEMAMYDGICHAGGVYTMIESDNGTLMTLCSTRGHDNPELEGWPLLRNYGRIIDELLKNKNGDAINKLLGDTVNIKGSTNTNISEALLKKLGTWPKWEKDGDLYVHPHFLKGSGEVLYFANKDNNKVPGWNATAIYYKGQWYQKIVSGKVTEVVVADVHKFGTVDDALKPKTNGNNGIGMLKEDGSINTEAGWQRVP